MGTVTALTEVFDQNGDFNTNGTFTAPVTGKYRFNGSCLLLGNSTLNEGILQFNASNGAQNCRFNRPASSLNMGINGCILVDMDAADTCTFSIQGSGEAADTSDVQGSSQNTYVAGSLLC